MGRGREITAKMNHQVSLARCTPIDPANRTLGFYLSDAGHAVVPAHSVYPSNVEKHSQKYPLSWEKGRILQDFQVVYISKGKGIFQSTQSGLIPLKAGDAFLLFPREWHSYQPDSEVGWTEFWISFNGDYAHELVSELFLSSCKPIIRIGHNDVLLQLLISLTKKMHSGPFFNPWVAAAQGIQVLTHLATANQRYGGEDGEKIEEVLSYISEHAEQTIDYRALAWNLKVSYSVFRRQFQKVAGMPHTQYQLMIRLSKAKELLCETSLPVGEIAEQLSFESPYYFSRFFKAKIGMTAREYRQTSSVDRDSR